MTVVEGVSHETLAHMLGATRQSVSRELKTLEKAGLIKFKYGRFMISELPTLPEQYDQLIDVEMVDSQYQDKQVD